MLDNRLVVSQYKISRITNLMPRAHLLMICSLQLTFLLVLSICMITFRCFFDVPFRSIIQYKFRQKVNIFANAFLLKLTLKIMSPVKSNFQVQKQISSRK